jgi:Rhodopirellula transposase DDE domain
VLRLSIDAKATVKVGDYSRGGKNRVQVQAADHDFHPSEVVTLVGILLPKHDELTLYAVLSKVTSDCLGDLLNRWWETNRERFAGVKTLLLNLDNGPESHSRRTQFLFRLVDFVQETGITLQLAYYPPYHSKYNPIERCWGVLENHWNGDLLDTVHTVLAFAGSMTWKGKHPTVELITKTYHTGVRLSQKAMAALETQVRRLPGLDKWFVEIRPDTLTDGTIIFS